MHQTGGSDRAEDAQVRDSAEQGGHREPRRFAAVMHTAAAVITTHRPGRDTARMRWSVGYGWPGIGGLRLTVLMHHARWSENALAEIWKLHQEAVARHGLTSATALSLLVNLQHRIDRTLDLRRRYVRALGIESLLPPGTLDRLPFPLELLDDALSLLGAQRPDDDHPPQDRDQ